MSKVKVGLFVGGINLLVSYPKGAGFDIARPPFKVFVSEPCARPDFEIDVILDSRPDVIEAEPIFDTEYSWGLFACRQGYLYKDYLQNEARQDFIRYAIIDKEFRKASVYCTRTAVEAAGFFNWIFDVPLGQFIMTNLIVARGGLMIHACGIKYKDKAFIFTGPSGAGKSTIAQLWGGVPDAVVLSDERLLLRKSDSGFHVFGTPWTGSSFGFAQDQALLDEIYLIQHALEDKIFQVSSQQALAVFLSNMRLPLWDSFAARKAMDLAASVLEAIPFFQLSFKPTPDIINLFLKQLKSRCG